MSSSRALLVLHITLATLPGCKSKSPAGSAEGERALERDGREDGVKPVYPTSKATAPSAIASRLCDALHTVPVTRRAECCQRKPGIVLTGECVRNLTGALNSGAVTLDEAAVAECRTAMQKAHEGCEWVGPHGLPLPDACVGILHGTLEPGAQCRSSLECKDGLRCLGVGPTDPGVCGPPARAGAFCETAVDPLAVYVREDGYETRHPACAGFCDRNRCADPVDVGAACRTNAECGRDRRCTDRVCVEGARAKAGEACLGGDCERGLRCVDRRCARPKPAGEACAKDAECLAACVRAGASAEGACGRSCDAFAPIRPPAWPSPTSSPTSAPSRAP